ncbi:methylated-DNA--[protein]-cysteine S-methyltransferase [Komagataeibacter sp. FNDCR2]|uniref:methylated-DNA--[protein]-cysteine S-methyltransferase n=1 Tax=Komagataeibacter sp. FNDCR2 TaxID=2878682 RepID=UPI001E4EA51F|nr:methylated-DNA--[protein]-cysteine S-methyltransferase [Komagataeibacter sp. FNDCR2]MCE2574412.1 methylated-DNA--[protein]-cysteine S-methyltransferase [Komagataeibacter sp. FNDCR2]
MTPSPHRPDSPDPATIRFAIGASSLGCVLVALGDDGPVAITLGDDPATLRHALQARFPTARPAQDEHDMAACLAMVTACIDRPWALLDDAMAVPPDRPESGFLNHFPAGTAFQRQVWRALRAIPCGTTITYAELAARVGRPGAARAVAGACAANMLAVIIPCHRVIRGDGSLSGYRWGAARKRLLLERERAWAASRTSAASG